MENFLNKDTVIRLLVYAENGRDYVAANHPPQKYKKKAMYFIKREACTLTSESMQENVLYGDSSDTPLESLSSVTNHVFLPLLTCADNQVGWPDFLTKELSESLHKFTANVFVAIGQMQGHTMLPLPAGVNRLLLVAMSILLHRACFLDSVGTQASQTPIHSASDFQVLTLWTQRILLLLKTMIAFTSSSRVL